MSKVTLSKKTIDAVSRTVYSDIESRYKEFEDKLSELGLNSEEDFKSILLPSIEQFSKLFKVEKSKPVKDPNKPKKPQTAYMIYLNENRKKIIQEFEQDGTPLTGKDRVTKVVQKAGVLWKEMSSDDKEPYVEKAVIAKEVYNKKMALYNPSEITSTPKGKIDFASLPVDVAPKGWTGPFEDQFLWGQAGKKKFGVGKFKTFDEAVKMAKTLIDEGKECAGITRDKTGYTLRQTSTLCPSKDNEHNVSWIFGEESTAEDKSETKPENKPKKKKLMKKKPASSKKVSFQVQKPIETPEPMSEESDSDEEEDNEISVVPITIEGVEYLYDETTNDIYDKTTNEPIGRYEDGDLKLEQ